MHSNEDIANTSLRIVNPLEHLDWDERLEPEDRSVFHSAAWARVLTETYGFIPLYLVPGGPSFRWVVPLMEVRSWLTGTRGVSLPFTDMCEIRLATGELELVLDEVMALGRRRKWKYLEFRGFPELKELREGAKPSVSFYTHTLALTVDNERLFSGCHSSIRRGIRRAEKSGVQITLSQSTQALKDFYRLHCITRKKHGIPPQPLSFFLNIGKHILSQNLGMIVSASHHGQSIASAIFFRYGNEAVYKFGASDPRFQDLRPNNLVMWTAIQQLAQTGILKLNFGRTSLNNEGLRHFKLCWGAAEQTIHYHKYSFREQGFVRSRDDSSGWHNRVFRALPRIVSRWSGALMYRHIA